MKIPGPTNREAAMETVPENETPAPGHAESEAPPPPAFVHPRPGAVRGAFAAAVALLAVCTWLALAGQPRLAAWLNDAAASPDEQAQRMALAAAVLVAGVILACLAVAAWLGAMAWRIRRAGTYPPPGYPVLAKTRQVQGRAARLQAAKHAAGGVAALLLGAGVLGGLFFYFPMAQVLALLKTP